MRKVLRGSKPIRFDWENKWLRGDQYAHMLYNLDNYSAVFGMQKLGEKTHPENIYVQPESKLKYQLSTATFQMDKFILFVQTPQVPTLAFHASGSKKDINGRR